MRALLHLAAFLFAVLVAESAPAEDTPTTPADTAKTPPEGDAPTPPPEPAPSPSASPAPSPPAPSPSAPPSTPSSESPSTPPPSAPPHKELPPAQVTLDETPEEPSTAPPPGTKPPTRRAAKAHRPKPEPAPEGAPASAEEPSEPSAETTSESDESKSKKEEGEGESKKEKGEGEGLFGPFRVGIILGVGLPSIVSFGGMIKLTRYFGAGLNIGLIPSIKLSLYGEAQLSYQEYDIYGRIFPFGGALFAGAGVGYASVSGNFEASYDTSQFQGMAQAAGLTVPNPLFVASNASVRVLVLTPTIGLLHTFGSGFTLGVDVGAQIPIAPSDTRFQTVVPAQVPQQIRDQYVTPNDQKVQDTLNSMSRTVIPTLNLRVGWLI